MHEANEPAFKEPEYHDDGDTVQYEAMPMPEMERTWSRNLVAKGAMVAELAEIGLSVEAIMRVLHLSEEDVRDNLPHANQKSDTAQSTNRGLSR